MVTIVEPLQSETTLKENDEATQEDEEVDRLIEMVQVEETPPRIFSFKDMKEPITCEVLNNVIYELGIVSLCWPQIEEPVFETRTCFPKSYYTNSTKERLLLAYAENFRQQFHFHYRNPIPLLLQVPNECGLQKMVCTSIRPTKLCFAGTITWQGIASLVGDYFDYEPITKPMLHAREIVAKVYHFMKKDAEEIFQIVNETPLTSGHGFLKLNDHLNNARKRTARAVGVSERTVSNILAEERKPGSQFKTPFENRKKRLPKLPLNSSNIEIIRSTIKNYPSEQHGLPTLLNLKRIFQEKLNFQGSVNTLRRTLLQLGYTWQKTVDNRRVIVKREDDIDKLPCQSGDLSFGASSSGSE